MSQDLAKYLRILLVLGIITLITAFLTVRLPDFRSTFVMVAPSPDKKNLTPPEIIPGQKVLTPPFDIVVEHQGCGTIDINTFKAYLESEKGGKVEVRDFIYAPYSTDDSTVRQRWILDNYDPATKFKQGSYGQFSLQVTADESFFCYTYIPLFFFKVAEYIGPPIFGPVSDGGPLPFGQEPYSGMIVFHSTLHDSGDKDYFTVKATGAPNGEFGSWFKITVSSENPSDYTPSDYPNDFLIFSCIESICKTGRKYSLRCRQMAAYSFSDK